MKKIITSVGMIVFVAAIVAGGTGAFFSDTESSIGNTFAAGEIDLLIDNSSYGFDWNRPGVVNPTGVWGANANNSWTLRDLDTCGPDSDQSCLFFKFEDLKPGDYGEDTISLHVQNDAWACMAFNLTGTPENDVNEPEADVPDLTVGANQGELQDYLEFVFWKDDGDNVLEVGETVIQGLSGLAKDIFNGTKLAIADSSTVGGPLPAAVDKDDASYIGKGWCFGDLVVAPVEEGDYEGPTEGNTGFTCDPTGNHNVAQTDGIEVDVTFDAVQARHNDKFLCAPRVEPETGSITIDKLIAFSDPALSDVDVTDFTFTLTGPGGAQVVFDEQVNSGLAPGAYTIEEVYTGDEQGLLIDATFSGACTEDGALDGDITLAAGENLTCTITNNLSLE